MRRGPSEPPPPHPVGSPSPAAARSTLTPSVDCHAPLPSTSQRATSHVAEDAAERSTRTPSVERDDCRRRRRRRRSAPRPSCAANAIDQRSPTTRSASRSSMHDASRPCFRDDSRNRTQRRALVGRSWRETPRAPPSPSPPCHRIASASPRARPSCSKKRVLVHDRHQADAPERRRPPLAAARERSRAGRRRGPGPCRGAAGRCTGWMRLVRHRREARQLAGHERRHVTRGAAGRREERLAAPHVADRRRRAAPAPRAAVT